MKNILYKLVVITGLAFGLISFNANAGLITSSGSWYDPQGSSSSINIDDDLIYWGWNKNEDPDKKHSAWWFEGVDKDITPEKIMDRGWFKIGKFHHWNNPIYDGHFTGAYLDLDLSIHGYDISTSLYFGHEETLNYPCKKETGKGCPDYVTLPYVASVDTITIGGMVYELTIKGYSHSENYKDGVLTTPEKGHSYAKLVAHLHKVPEPSIIALFGIGLLGLGFASRRKANG